VSRLPIRVRLTAVFILAMALVLLGVGAFVYLRLAASLDQTINDGLRSRADDVAALVRQSDSGLREGSAGLAEQGQSFAQVLDSQGRIVDTTQGLDGRPLLSPADLKRVAAGPVLLDRSRTPGLDDGARLLAAPVTAQDQGLFVVVGTSLEGRKEALSGLLVQLLVGGPIALALAAVLAFALAAAALRPVEEMRREAEAITGRETGRRLPVSVARDEIARLGTTLNEMLSRLESALARERSFVADASHELRTPLALLKAELEVALRQPRSAAELETALRSAANEADRLTRLAEDLLVLARADQGRLPVRAERMQAADLLRTVNERFATRAAEAGRELSTTVGEIELSADRLRLEQALSNLVDNAFRHGAGAIRLETSENDGALELHVLDEGPGFDTAFLERAFLRFARSDESRSEEGSGLGLAITAMIARAHGGAAGARNRPDGGADVWISLPGRRP
jgi:heavy metal sensor kinase